MHVLEIYGAEGCCDEVTAWSFNVNNGDELDFTVENLNKFWGVKEIDEENNLCINMTEFEKECSNISSWHYSINRT